MYVASSFIFGLIMIALSANILSTGDVALWIDNTILLYPTHAIIFGLLGGLIVLLCLNKLQKILFHSRREKMIKLESPGGPVNITILAIEDMIKRSLEKNDNIVKVRPKVSVRKNKLIVTIRGYLTSAINLLEFSQGVQAKINEKLRGALGEETKVDIIVEIRKMVPSNKKEPEEKESEVEFNYF